MFIKVYIGRIEKASKKSKGVSFSLSSSLLSHSTTTFEGSNSQTTGFSDKSSPSPSNKTGLSRLLPFSSYVSGVSSWA